jgi:hypothetical protein
MSSFSSPVSNHHGRPNHHLHWPPAPHSRHPGHGLVLGRQLISAEALPLPPAQVQQRQQSEIGMTGHHGLYDLHKKREEDAGNYTIAIVRIISVVFLFYVRFE